MKVLFVLVLVFVIAAAVSRLTGGQWNLPFAGNLAMFIMLCFTALGHFKFTDGMVMMMPSVLPLKKEFVYLTGVAEILLGFALLFPASRSVAAYVLIALFVLMLPANINAAVKHISFEKANYEGPGIAYLWFRIPMQVFLIAWLWFFALKR